MPDVTLHIVDEDELEPSGRRQVGALLSSVFAYHDARHRGWTQCRPRFRVLAFDAHRLVAQRSTCFLTDDRESISIAGFGDMAVRDRWRGRGLARAMTAMAMAEALRREPDVLLACTERMRSVFEAHGFRPALPREVVIGPEDREDQHMLVRWMIPPMSHIRLSQSF
jgi:GNAT superfamily N-acetyltransferase